SNQVPVLPFGVSGFQRAACASRLGGTCESPATWPRSLFANPSLSVPASVPRSRDPPTWVQMKAWWIAPGRSAVPATSPASLMLLACVLLPPSPGIDVTCPPELSQATKCPCESCPIPVAPPAPL